MWNKTCGYMVDQRRAFVLLWTVVLITIFRAAKQIHTYSTKLKSLKKIGWSSAFLTTIRVMLCHQRLWGCTRSWVLVLRKYQSSHRTQANLNPISCLENTPKWPKWFSFNEFSSIFEDIKDKRHYHWPRILKEWCQACSQSFGLSSTNRYFPAKMRKAPQQIFAPTTNWDISLLTF